MKTMRKNIRLKNFDYSQNGYYFITICTDFKKLCLSEIVCESEKTICILTPIGEAVKETIQYIHNNYDGVAIEKYCIMPNHIHLIIALGNAHGGLGNPPLRDVIGRLKSFTTKRFREIQQSPHVILWQRDYYEHIIRNDEDYAEKWHYIDENPIKWFITHTEIQQTDFQNGGK